MKQKTLKLLTIVILCNLLFSHCKEYNSADSAVSTAVTLSDISLNNAHFEEALELLNRSNFRKYKNLTIEHELCLTLQEIQVRGFKNIVRFEESKPQEIHSRLVNFQPKIKEIRDTSLLGNFFYALSKSYQKIGKADSVIIYQENAFSAFQKCNNMKRIADMRAGIISRKQLDLLNQGKKEEILALIPKYQEEIEFSGKHSKEALAYNTRHLAQIHMRQTFDFEEALRLFKESLDIRLEIGFRPFLPASYSSLGDVYLKMGDHENAIEMFQKSIDLATEIGFLRYQSYPVIQIGDICLLNGEDKKAMSYYDEALKLATKHEFTPGVEQATERINKISIDKE
jgi:tetratricopeptide (TPR) repeat protein